MKILSWICKHQVWLWKHKNHDNWLHASIAKALWRIVTMVLFNNWFLTKHADAFSRHELTIICGASRISRKKLNVLYKACSIHQKADLLMMLDERWAIRNTVNLKTSMYPSSLLIQQDYLELSKIYRPDHYEPEEVILERDFRSKW